MSREIIRTNGTLEGLIDQLTLIQATKDKIPSFVTDYKGNYINTIVVIRRTAPTCELVDIELGTTGD